jgi:hypothetical protein
LSKTRFQSGWWATPTRDADADADADADTRHQAQVLSRTLLGRITN